MRALLMILIVVLAGCSEAPVVEEEEFLEAEPTPTTGSVSGVLVDLEIRPIAGGELRIDALEITASSDKTGKFVFNDLEPGIYAMTAVAETYLETQQTIEVIAGKTSTVRVMLDLDLTPVPFFDTFKFDGRIEFHATVLWAQLEWMLDTYGGITTPACACVATFEREEIPTGHIYEAVWTDTITDPRGPNENYWSYAVPEPYQELFGYAPSPIYRTWEEGAFEEETGEYKVMLLGDADGVAVQQEFEIFLTHWFNGPVPEGWSVVEQST